MQRNKYNKRWHRRAMLCNQTIPADILPWLFDSSSLTKRLLQRCPDDFRVEVLVQSVSRPTLDERRTLGIGLGKSALIREVILYCGEHAAVYARTVIPLSTLTGAQRCYANLGDRPLGAMLFSDRSMRRDEVEVTLLMPGDLLYANIACVDESVWGRRSVFRVGGKPLLVCEIFLPSVLK